MEGRALALLGALLAAVILVAVLANANAIWRALMRLTLKEWVEVVQAIVTILATGFAAFLAWFGFFRKRVLFPRARVEHRVTHLPLPDGKILLWVGVVISNLGDVKLDLGKADVRVEQLLPPPPDLADQVGPDCGPKEPGKREFDWGYPPARCNSPVTNCIEPGESDSIVYTFLLEPGPQVVSIYSFFRNDRASREREIGWRTSSVYDFRRPSPSSPLLASTVEGTPSSEPEGRNDREEGRATSTEEGGAARALEARTRPASTTDDRSRTATRTSSSGLAET